MLQRKIRQKKGLVGSRHEGEVGDFTIFNRGKEGQEKHHRAGDI